MAWDDCKAVIEAAAGREFTHDEITRLLDAAEVRLNAKLRKGLSRREATAQARRELTDEATLQAIIAKRTTYMNRLVWQDLIGAPVGKEARTIMAALNGVAGGTERGLAAGVYPTYFGIRDGKFLGPLAAKLEREGLLSTLKAGDAAFDRDVARELYRRLDPEAAKPTGNERAVKVASIVGEMQEYARLTMNKAGAWIGQLDNYIARQSHDPVRMSRDGVDPWREHILARLDIEKTFGEDATAEDIHRALGDVYNRLITGFHDTAGNPVLRAFGGPGSLGKKVSQSRSLIFKDGDAWFEYNAKYGQGKVLDAIVTGLDRAARDTALMQKFGTNPEHMFNRWVAELQGRVGKRGDRAEAQKLGGSDIHGVFKVVNGVSTTPGNHTIASVGTFVRDLMQLSKLGQVWASAFPDMVLTAATLRHNGVPYTTAIGRQIEALLPSSKGRREVAHMLGAAIDNTMGAMIHRFRGGDEVNGTLSKAVGTFHKLNLLAPWTDAMKEGVSLSLSANLATHSAKTFDKLPPLMQATLRRYGIEDAEWEAARTTGKRAADGRSYILPADMADEKLGDKFRTYIVDQMREALTEPTARARYIVTAGTSSGTVVGEVVRTLTQFKSFSATFMERHMGREFRRDGVNVPGVIQLAVGLTVMGLASIMLKEAAAGRIYKMPEDARGVANLLGKAFVQGGAGGLIADSLLRDAKGFSGGLIESLAGPTAGTAEDVVKFLQDVAVGDKKERRTRGEIALREGLPIVQQNLPFSNLLWTQGLMNYLFVYRLQEAVNPGYLRRFEKRVEDSGRTWLPGVPRPSEAR